MITRRSVLRAFGTGLAATASPLATQQPALAAPRRLSGRVRLKSLHIAAGDVVEFNPNKSTTVELSGNVVVKGTLRMRPARPGVKHRLRFVNVDESRFQGGGMKVLASDIGLWVVDGGRLDAHGSAKRGWTRARGGLKKGQRRFKVRDASGWRVGDKLAIVPTGRPSKPKHYQRYDHRRIRKISGNTITLNRGLRFPHPKVNRRWAPEVLNLTRNVVIEGTPGGKAHVMFLHQHRVGDLRYVELRHLGPNRQNDRGQPEGVLGRYALHYHHCGMGSHGTVVKGVVAHHCGNHAFVPHGSHGMEFRDCVSHGTVGDAFWWDPGDETHSTLWHRCVASLVRREGNRYTTTGFLIGRGGARPLLARGGRLNTCRRCVAVGVQGPDSSGYFWNNGNHGVWAFSRNMAHNIQSNGFRVWQNTSHIHALRRSTIYHCRHGVDHGAYGSCFRYVKALIYGCLTGLEQHAQSRLSQSGDYDLDGTIDKAFPTGRPLRFEKVRIRRCKLALKLTNGARDASPPAKYRDCRIGSVTINQSGHAYCAWDFIGCGLTPRKVKIVSTNSGGFRLRAQNGDNAWKMDETGTVTTIRPFA